MQTCVDPIEFSPRFEDDLLVVDGKITASDGPHTVKLSRTDQLGRSANFPAVTGATLTLTDQLGNEYFFVENGIGIYQLWARCFEGNTYTLHIRLSDGLSYESSPETMPALLPADSAFFNFDGYKNIAVYARFTASDVAREEGPYYKWRVDHIYQVSEIYCGPLDPTNTCYVSRRPDNQALALADGSRLQRGASYDALVKQLIVDKTFGEASYFNIYQESVGVNAYRYWSKISLLLSQRGSFFDAPPGTIRGNIFNTQNPNELVLGYFYAAPEDTLRVKTIGGDFSSADILPVCGAPGFPPYPFNWECCDCTTLPNSTLERPWYW